MGADKVTFVASIPMPFTGESIVDGILVTWHVKPGDKIKKGQHIADIETEKSTWDFEAPCGGEVTALKCNEGDVVDVGAPLLEVSTTDANVKHLEKGAAAATAARAGRISPEGGAAKENGSSSTATGGTRQAAAGESTAKQAIAERHARDEETGRSLFRRLSPRLKKMVTDANIGEAELAHIEATGPDGQLTAADIGSYLDRLEAEEAASGGTLRTCYLRGLGTHVPSRVVENQAFLADFTDINENYIEKVTGIRQRRWVESETTSDLAVLAARSALDSAGLDKRELDLIIVATTTPDMPLPATACAVQQKLGCSQIPAFDIAAACSGWLYALSIGRQYVQTGVYRNVLVIAAEVMSKFTDKTDRATAFLFGDGAGAAVLSSEKGPGSGHELGHVIMEADSSGYDIIDRKAGGSQLPPGSTVSAGDEYWYMDGGRMFRGAVTAFSDIIESVARESGIPLEQFDWVVPHQANQRILKSVAHKLKVPMERFFFNIEKYGNTSAASIPLCLKEMETTGRLKPGQKVLLCAVGAGLTIAGCVLSW
ncbi:beta-ketoacyl-ACP synthase 3 [Salinispira pacifica]